MRDRRRGNALARAAATILILVAHGSSRPLGAQERTAVTIDYVGAEGVYLAVGADQGLEVGDTLRAFAEASGEAELATLVLVMVTRRRSVARPLGAAPPLGRGTVVHLSLPAPPAPSPDPPAREAQVAAPSGARRPTAVGPVGGAAGGVGRGLRSAEPLGPRVTGRFSLDVDARETRTSWSGDLSGETRRRFLTPTSRLSLTLSDLPGGFRLRTNVRGSYRYAELGVGAPERSVRAYEVSATKTFDSAPLEVRLGRFYNPYERYSSYWDGLLLRIGRLEGVGVGVVAGFEPSRYDEGFSTDVPKVTGFADFAARGRGWRYDTDVSFHATFPDARTLSESTFAGWSQRMTLGPLRLDQRLRMDRAETDGRWSLTQLRVRGSLAVARPLRIRGGFGRIEADLLPGGLLASRVGRDEITAGLLVLGRHGSLSLDAGRTEREGDEAGLSLSGRASLRVGRSRLHLSGRRWARGGATSQAASPGLSVLVAGVTARAAYRLYRTAGPADPLTSHAAELHLSRFLGVGLRVTLRAQRQWGANLEGSRVQLGLWRSF